MSTPNKAPRFGIIKAMTYDEILEDFYVAVSRQLQRTGLSQVELAKRLGVSKSYVTKALKDGRSLSLKTMILIADALGLTVTARFVRKKRQGRA